MDKVLKISILFGLLWVQIGFAQTENRPIGEFSEINVGGSFDVYLKQGSKAELKIEAQNVKLEDIITEVSGDKLTIKLRDRLWNVNGRSGKIWLTYTNLKKINSSGSSNIQAEGKIKGEELRISLSGSGNVAMEVELKRLEINISGSADAEIKGKTQEQEITISGSGGLKAIDLESEKANIRISGSGDAKVYVKEEIEARVSGSGKVKFKGNPTKQITKSSGSGSVSSF